MRNLLAGFVGLCSLFIFFACQKEVSLEYGTNAIGSLQGAGGECLPKLVGGSYVAGKPVNDSNFLDVTVDVAVPGPYAITTDTVNGIVFKAAGTVPEIGTNVVRLKAFGVPVDEGDYTYTIIFDSTWCEVTVSFLPSGSTGGPAVFTLDGAPGSCAAIDLNGSFIKDTVLDSSVNIQVNVDVTTVGTYTISTNTVNGYSFSATGTFGATGPAQVTLYPTGTPQAAGTDNFTVTAGTSTCTFPVTVTANTTPNPGGPCGATPAGTYTAGTALAAANTIVISHTYTTAGPYTVSTNTVNGISFGPASINAAAGTATSITLTGTGTPTAAGTNTFTIDFGDGQTCTFTVTVNPAAPPVNQDYFPIAANNWWSYTYTGAGPTDTVIMKVMGPITLGGNNYQHFGWVTDPASTNSFDDYYYRKDATGNYYEGIDTSDFGFAGITFNRAILDINFLKNTLTTGQSWNTDFPVTVDDPSYTGPAVIRFKYTCANASATLTTGTGATLTNVYEIHWTLQIGIGGAFQDVFDGPKTFYGRGIGQVKYLNDSNPNPANHYEELIRYWQVN